MNFRDAYDGYGGDMGGTWPRCSVVDYREVRSSSRSLLHLLLNNTLD